MRDKILSLGTILLETVTAGNLLSLIDSQRKRGEKVRVHPNGFLQLSLSPDAGWRDQGLRLHVWTDELVPQKDPSYQIHDHIFDIESYVLCGTLVNTLYYVEENVSGDHVLIEAGVEELKDTQKRVFCRLKEVQTVHEGERYSISGHEFHTSHASTPFTATLMAKSNVENFRKPHVLFLADYDAKAMILTRSIDQELGWRMIKCAEEEILKRYG